MKKILSVLLAGALVAGMALTAGASDTYPGLYRFDESDSEYWDNDVSMLDKTEVCVWLQSGEAASTMHTKANDPSGADIEENLMTNMKSGWYEVVFAQNAGKQADFDAIDADGKIVLCVRGGVQDDGAAATFTTKSALSAENGAVACLVANSYRGEEFDENGMIGMNYSTYGMQVEGPTLPMCMVPSDFGAILISEMTGVKTGDVALAMQNSDSSSCTTGSPTESVGLEPKNSTWVFVGSEAEFKAAGEPSATPTAAPVEEETTAPETAAPETTAPETTAPETTAPADETVTAPAPVEAAPQTFDIGVIAGVAAIVSAIGYAVAKKR